MKIILPVIKIDAGTMPGWKSIHLRAPARVHTHTPHEVISGNIATTISEHLPQFLIAPNVFANPSSKKSNIFERNW